ncbi:uncharacterized protein LOC133780599 [Humulus lupulus]|uniref:uncharacterized protein LOC133780599 n=1 Tax=Humulus lupulus TaxID=3486 RepID=UPI002B40B91E|nr:uncharacterized protein LOC133780599 [Humulus lupulus]
MPTHYIYIYIHYYSLPQSPIPLFSSLIFLNLQIHTMLDVTLDLISQTASSSLFAFCFCNLIIVIILVGSKPVSSEFAQKQSHHAPLSLVSVPNTVTHDNEVENANGLREEERNVLEVICEQVSNGQKELGNEESFDDHRDDGNDDNQDDDDDDEQLRKRVEDFIQKVNREWKEELIRTSL